MVEYTVPQTTVVKNYYWSREGFNVHNDIDRWDELAPYLRAQDNPAGEYKGTACQVMTPDMMSKLFLDLDDRLPTLAEAKAQTAVFVEWAQTTLPDLLGIPTA